MKRSRKFRSLLPLDDNVPERSSGIELIPAGKTGDKLLVPRLGRRSVVVVWTKNSSEWVLEEAKKVNFRGILIPVLLGNVQPPFGFGSIQAANLAAWNGDGSSPTFLL